VSAESSQQRDRFPRNFPNGETVSSEFSTGLLVILCMFAQHLTHILILDALLLSTFLFEKFFARNIIF
jgi:hypothetical protein